MAKSKLKSVNQILQLSTEPSDGVQLRVTFNREADRWSHVIERIEGDQATTILSSIEGTSDDDWPPSPPLQELSVHDLGNTQAILGVGMAGAGHWSISCTVEDSALKFELACLVKDKEQLESLASDRLGSRYQNGSSYQNSGGQLGLELIPLSDDQDSNPAWATEVSSQESDLEFTFCPRLLSTRGTVATRWAYQISLG